MRIVSLLPSATEMLAALGLTDSLVGVSHSCDWPPGIARLPRVTRTMVPKDASAAEMDRMVREQRAAGLPLYQLDALLLQRLKPDLVVTQGLCDVCAVTESQAHAACSDLPSGVEVISLAPLSLADVFGNIVDLGLATETLPVARRLVAALSERRERVAAAVQDRAERPRVSLLEWVTPLYAGGHWTPEIIALAGGQDGHGRPGQASRHIDWEEVSIWQPEVLVLACCGLDIPRTMTELAALAALPGFRDLPAIRNGQLWVVDGVGHFSRPGPRLLDSLEWLAGTLHPGLGLPDGAPAVRMSWSAENLELQPAG